MEIARSAAALFMRHGLRATRAEDIARAAGIAPRTFYRYFASKEEALGPLFAAGAQKWAEAVRDAPGDLSVPEALRHAVVQTLTPGVGVRRESLEWVRSLLRLAETSPALLRVWAEACQAGERTLAGVLGMRVSGGEGSAAPDISAAAASTATAPIPADTTPAAPTPTAPTAVSPELRFGAAVASAAVRVAVEAWAAGDATVDGPDSPAELALRHLGALRDFPWNAA